jgi:hypothetical protein
MRSTPSNSRTRPYGLLIISLVSALWLATAGLAWLVRIPQAMLRSAHDHLWCSEQLVERAWSPDGQYEATFKLMACGGAAGYTMQLVELRTADDPWGGSTQTLLTGSARGMSWQDPRHLRVEYGPAPGQTGPTQWREVMITYELRAPLTPRPGFPRLPE